MSKPNDFPPQDQTFVSHLVELRDRLLRAVLAVLVIFGALFAFANDLYTLLAEPLLRQMPGGAGMIATEVASPFFTPVKLTMVLSIFLAMPVILYQLWAFVAPGLYQTERKLVLPLLVSSTVLFYLGMAFAYFVVFPLVFHFLTNIAPQGVAVMPDISKYLDFVLKMFFAFGVAFEVPIATILVIWTGLTTAESLASKRPYIIVVAFVVGMLLTPPDVFSQTLLALPMWALFELGLFLSKFYVKPAEESEASEDAADPVNGESDYPSETQSAYAADGGDEEYRPLNEQEMDDELDRIEAAEMQQGDVDEDQDTHVSGDDDYSDGPHEEYEPISEEEARRLDNPDGDKPEEDLDKDHGKDHDKE
jgi:sec-independent protein translocase protein TatC